MQDLRSYALENCRGYSCSYLPIIRMVNEPGTAAPWGPWPPPGETGRLVSMGRLISMLEALLVSPITWGVVALILGAIALSGRLSLSAANAMLIVAWAAAGFGVYRAEAVLHLPWILRSLLTMLAASVFGIGFYYLSAWLTPRPVTTATNATPQNTALSRNLIDLKQGWLSRCARFRYTQRFARQRTDQAAGMAGLPSLPA